jgi:hypothetical protein
MLSITLSGETAFTNYFCNEAGSIIIVDVLGFLRRVFFTNFWMSLELRPLIIFS